jgi:TonB family protein
MDDALGETFGESVSAATSRNKATTEDPQPESAARMQVDSSASDGSIFSDPKIPGIGAAAVVVLLGLGWWMFSGPDEAAPIEEPLTGTPMITEADPVFNVPAVVETDAGVDDLIEEARLAAAAGQIFNPPGSNAVELYLAASTAAPANVTVASELAAVIEQTLGMAETSLLEHRAEDASAALQRVALADPANARLPFLNAQLAQMQLRDYLNASRLAIRDGRYEDASVALDAARALGLDSSAEINIVADELSAALSEQRVDDVLVKANARLDEGKLTAPSNDNARYYFELALSNDPENAAAGQGLDVIASKLVLQARAEIDAGQFDAADILLADARRLDPGSSELAASTSALATARDRAAEQIRAADQRVADEKAAAERAEAERVAADALAAEQAAAEQLAAEQAAAEQLAIEQATESQSGNDATVVLAAANTVESANVVANRSVADDAPVAASSLQRTKYVAPKYPRAAQRRNISGWVDVVFTVDIDGTVKDISVRDSNPGITFVNAAVGAVEDWEFAPVMESGTAIPKRAAVRMMFAIE